MTEPISDTISKKTIGINHPFMSYRFRLTFPSISESDGYCILTQQIQDISIDLISKTCKFSLWQPRGTDTYNSVVSFLEKEKTIIIESMPNFDIVDEKIIITGIKPIKHKMKLSYKKTDIVRHIITCRFSSSFSSVI